MGVIRPGSQKTLPGIVVWNIGSPENAGIVIWLRHVREGQEVQEHQDTLAEKCSWKTMSETQQLKEHSGLFTGKLGEITGYDKTNLRLNPKKNVLLGMYL